MSLPTAIGEAGANADTALDLWAYLIIGLPGTIGAVFAGIIGWKSRAAHLELAAKTDAIQESTVNDHDRPMRYDLDDVLAGLIAVRGDVAKLADLQAEDHELLQTIGGEVREDRKVRRDEDQALRDEDKALEDRRRVADKAIADRLDDVSRRVDVAIEWAKDNHPDVPPPDGL